MKKLVPFILALLVSFNLSAQEDTLRAEQEEPERKRGFQKDRLFTGGGIVLSLSSDGTVLGASPVFGYSLTKWLDAGIVVNYIQATQRNFAYYSFDDKLRQRIIGPGAFMRIYPVNFLFVHGQFEKNFIKQTLIPDNSQIPRESFKVSAPSMLVGAGYCNGRESIGSLFYYLSIMFDVLKDENSPYVERTQSGRIQVLPIVRAGLQIPLFQGKRLL